MVATEQTRYVIAPDVAWLDAAEVDTGRDTVWAAVLPDGRPVVMEESAAAIWRALADHDTVAEIVRDLAGDDDSAFVATMSGDVRTFLASLVAQGLVLAHEGPPPEGPPGTLRPR